MLAAAEQIALLAAAEQIAQGVVFDDDVEDEGITDFGNISDDEDEGIPGEEDGYSGVGQPPQSTLQPDSPAFILWPHELIAEKGNI